MTILRENWIAFKRWRFAIFSTVKVLGAQNVEVSASWTNIWNILCVAIVYAVWTFFQSPGVRLLHFGIWNSDHGLYWKCIGEDNEEGG